MSVGDAHSSSVKTTTHSDVRPAAFETPRKIPPLSLAAVRYVRVTEPQVGTPSEYPEVYSLCDKGGAKRGRTDSSRGEAGPELTRVRNSQETRRIRRHGTNHFH